MPLSPSQPRSFLTFLNTLLPGHTSQVYAIRQALAKGIVAFYQKFVDEASKKEIKDILVHYDRSLLVADPRRCEPKKVLSCVGFWLLVFDNSCTSLIMHHITHHASRQFIRPQ